MAFNKIDDGFLWKLNFLPSALSYLDSVEIHELIDFLGHQKYILNV